VNKINYRILLEAIFQVVKPILIGILIAIALLTVFLLLLAVLGELFPVVLLVLSLLTILSMLIKNNYDELALKHRRNQKEVMDILKK
jgi:predicted tellurium resistance membrane protein TerC